MYAYAQGRDGISGYWDELFPQFYSEVFKTFLCLIQLGLHSIVLDIELIDDTCA